MRTPARGIPLWFKILYTAFCAVLIPNYLQDYGPTNFLYFCDVALLMTLTAVWIESPLLVSMPSVGIMLPQMLWAVDFLGTAAGFPITGMTAYMFNEKLPLFTRGLSFFHFWLPFALAWLVWKLGYDRRALIAWTGLAWALLAICYLFMPAPPASNPKLPVNINYVYGPSDQSAQTWVSQQMWLAGLFIGLPALIFYPTHRLLLRLAPQARR